MDKLDEGLVVLSLFDGMSCGQIALEQAGIKVKAYYASEIKSHGIKVTQDNYPNTIQLGDVTKVSFKDGILSTENGEFEVGNIDIVIGGSPCQNFSIACISEHRKGLDGDKSKLFYEYLRILKEANPKYFLLENVASMDKQSKKELDTYMNIEGTMIDSLNFLPQSRKRLYWTNIDISQYEKKKLKLQDYLDSGYTPKQYSSCLLEGHSRPTSDKLRLTRRHLEKNFIPVVYESKEKYEELIEHYNTYYKGLNAKEVDAIRDNIDNSVYSCVRILSSSEMERLQGVPIRYTKSVSRNEAASLLGDGWTVDVIAHIFKGLIK